MFQSSFSRLLIGTFAVLSSLFYAVIFAGQILGLAGIYNLPAAMAITVLIGGVAFFYLFQELQLQIQVFSSYKQGWLDAFIGLAGLLLVLALILKPLAFWPYSPISTELSWDAGLYHFPKAIEMLVTGSVWDLSIAYGEYPFGYESLIAFAFGLNHAGYLIGTLHALIALYMLIAFWMILMRHTTLPQGMAFFLAIMVVLSQYFLPSLDANIWWPIWPQVVLIGKNDLLLGGLLITLVMFLPTNKESTAAWMGISITSMIALSVKPNAILMVLFVWGAIVWGVYKKKLNTISKKQLFLLFLVVAPGMLWALRNFIAQGVLFSPETGALAGYSIAANLFNPYFYNYIPRQLMIVTAIILLGCVFALLGWRIRWMLALAGIVMLVSFALTPASAFLGDTQQPTQIAWRFSLGVLIYVFFLLVKILEPLIIRVFSFVVSHRYLATVSAFMIAILSITCLFLGRELIQTQPQNDIVLRDQYRVSVGTDGYFSAYDYVKQNIRNSVVIVENGLPFYLYDPNFTNSVTRARPADYAVVLQTAWHEGQDQAYPEIVNEQSWQDTWLLIYEDSQGRVYNRRP